MKPYNYNKILNYIFVSLDWIFKMFIVLLFLFPFYWMIITSLKTNSEAILVPPTLWPRHFTLEGYIILIQKIKLFTYVKNSVFVTFGCIILELVIMVPAAYAFAKFDFIGKKLFFAMILVAFMIPTQLTFITVYLMMAKHKLLNTLLPQILPFGANAFGIFLLRQTFMQIPDEIIESARLDNAKEAKIMFKLMLPMCQSTVVTIALFSFVGHWNSYFWPLVMTDKEIVRPLTIALEKLKDVEYGINWNLIMAGNVLLVFPILIIFVFASRKIIQAFAYKGVK
ncbi:carbohydrate ABC transporter permease [Treponema parvum]|uniref:Carbohydrate ABC transporter permease n=1 Tax=Treponema parvum TaxID=138851 RepID=A0A975F448_9SPIR|nr:carbohydrate ABC transporter permease [Treponema parvum]QTQ13674.1 carbohydrate ABC transporter permease [Treponema parvum]